MNERELRHALRELPVPRAGDAFTRDVLRRLDEADGTSVDHPSGVGPLTSRLLALAATLALVLGGAAAWRADARADRDREVRSLRSESHRLHEEIRALEDRLQDPTPVLYVGGTETVDLVVDLSRVSEVTGGPAAESRTASAPASGGVL